MRNLFYIISGFLFISSIHYAQLTVKDQESTPNILMQVNDEGDAGSITLQPLSSIGTNVNKLYNLGGSLYWNNSELGFSESSGWQKIGGKVTLQTNTDFVGIGNSDPQVNLDITSSAVTMASKIRLGNADNTHTLFLFSGNSTDLPYISFTDGDALRFAKYDGTVNEIMRITSDGKMGIGTSTPNAHLHVAGNDGVLFTGTIYNGIIPAEGGGTRMMWYPRKAAFRVGSATSSQWDDVNIGNNSTAMGSSTTASGYYSTASGLQTKASGYSSTAMGYLASATGDFSAALGISTKATGTSSIALGDNTTASGICSIALGQETEARGDRSTAMGFGTTASGKYATAMGNYTTANCFISTAIGRYNIGGTNLTSWVLEDPIFEVGIGNSSTNKANAFTVLKNGNVGIGTHSPTSLLHVVGSNLAKLATSNDGVYGESSTSGGSGVAGINTGSGNGVYGRSTSGYAGKFEGDVNITGVLSKGSGTFKIDHPLDPENKYLNHSFVESPDMMNIYNGNVITDKDGYVKVTLPEWFGALNKDFRYQLTVIGSFAQAIISQEIIDNIFSIRTDKPNVKVSWQVTGIRKDAFAEMNRVQVEEFKNENERGKYLHPEAFNIPVTASIK